MGHSVHMTQVKERCKTYQKEKNTLPLSTSLCAYPNCAQVRLIELQMQTLQQLSARDVGGKIDAL